MVSPKNKNRKMGVIKLYTVKGKLGNDCVLQVEDWLLELVGLGLLQGELATISVLAFGGALFDI